jgi:aminoglycoside phosphotransferase (APT) family kinase protein
MATGDDLAEALPALLGRPPGTTVQELRRLSGGASRDTWSFDLRGPGGTEELILQRQRAGAAGTAAMETEAALLRAAAAEGVPVPAVIATDDGARLGAAAMIVERLEGETIPRKLLRDRQWDQARSQLCRHVAGAAARIHRIPPDRVDGLSDIDQLEQFRDLLDSLGQPHPAFELGLRWLDRNRPPPGRRTVVHGDLRLGNLLVDRTGLRAVLDWELAHLGDPVEDLGWFCVRAWRFGSPLPAGGVCSRDELLDAYETASGHRVTPAELRWWEAFGTLRWGVICIMQASAHLNGLSRSVELAAIGRRVCENEWDLLALLPGGPVDAVPPPDPHPSPPGLHGRPTAGELVEAVREWVETDVRAATEGRVSFHSRVAANALAIVGRELADAGDAEAAHRERLATLGCGDDAELAARIRSGELDARYDEVRRLVGESVRAKLSVANPAHLSAR